jgi:gas vesicle protein
MSAKGIWIAFGLGVSAGAAVALLYAPQPGVKTRKQLRKNHDDGVDYLEDAAGYLKEQAEFLAKEAQKTVKRAKARWTMPSTRPLARSMARSKASSR